MPPHQEQDTLAPRRPSAHPAQSACSSVSLTGYVTCTCGPNSLCWCLRGFRHSLLWASGHHGQPEEQAGAARRCTSPAGTGQGSATLSGTRLLNTCWDVDGKWPPCEQDRPPLPGVSAERLQSARWDGSLFSHQPVGLCVGLFFMYGSCWCKGYQHLSPGCAGLLPGLQVIWANTCSPPTSLSSVGRAVLLLQVSKYPVCPPRGSWVAWRPHPFSSQQASGTSFPGENCSQTEGHYRCLGRPWGLRHPPV